MRVVNVIRTVALLLLFGVFVQAHAATWTTDRIFDVPGDPDPDVDYTDGGACESHLACEGGKAIASNGVTSVILLPCGASKATKRALTSTGWGSYTGTCLSPCQKCQQMGEPTGTVTGPTDWVKPAHCPFGFIGIAGGKCQRTTQDDLFKNGGGCEGSGGSGGECPANGTNPIHSKLGTKMQTEIDIEPLGRGLLRLERYYNSGAHMGAGEFGPNWRHTYERALLSGRDGQSMFALRPNGNLIYFNKVGATWAGETDRPEQLLELTSGSARIGWRLTTADDSVEEFNGMGYLTSITRRDGAFVTLSYERERLSAVTDDQGRKMTFGYLAAQLTTITTPDGREYRYEYNNSDANGTLKRVIYPDNTVATSDNPSRTYLYEDSAYLSALTGIEEFDGTATKRFATWAYLPNDGRAWLSFHGPAANFIDRSELTFAPNGTQTTIRHYSSAQTYVDRTYSFQTFNGVVKQTSISAPCFDCGNIEKDRSYDAKGDLASTTNFENTVTEHHFDARNLEDLQIESKSTPSDSSPATKRTTTTTWHADFRVPTSRTVSNGTGQTEALTRWSYNIRGQETASCVVDPANAAAMAYTCGSLVNAPTGVRQVRRTYCEASDVATPGTTCPRLGLPRTIDGPRTDVSDVTTVAYRPADEASCGTGGACAFRKGDLWSVTNPVGHVTEYVAYDKSGRIARVKDANGVLTDFVYDPRGWLLTRTIRANSDGSSSAQDATTTFSRTTWGAVRTITDAGGSQVSYSYDDAHRLTDVVDALGDRLHYELDGSGKRIREQTFDPQSALTRALARQYNVLGQLTAEIRAPDALQTDLDAPGILKSTRGYSLNGNHELTVDQLGVRSRKYYDPLNRLVKSVGDEGTGTINATSEFLYDARDNLRKVIDPKALETIYQYDGLNNLGSLTSPDTGTTSYDYDAAGNRTRQTDARGVVTNYAYDQLGRLTSATHPSGLESITYAYDTQPAACAGATFPKGRLTEMSDEAGTTSYCYDRRGNLTMRVWSNATLSYQTAWQYDLRDAVISVVYPSGARVRYTRDAAGQVIGVYRTPVGGAEVVVASTIAREPFGPIRAITFADANTLTYTRDKNYAIDAIASTRAAGLTLSYGINARGEISLIDGETYSYDNLGRLKEARTAGGALIEAYTYDATGNRLSRQDGTATPVSYAYPSNSHRLSSVGSAARTYDANGNTVSASGIDYTFGENNRLAQIDSSSVSLLQLYNGRGERTSIRRDGNDFQTIAIYDQSGLVLSEIDAVDTFQCELCELRGGKRRTQDSKSPPLREVQKAGDSDLAQFLREYVYVDGQPIAFVYGATVAYIEADHLGTPRKAFQSNSLVFNWPLLGNPFGAQSATTSLPISLRFPGQQVSRWGGLYYNYFRDYAPEIGRYVESDPIGLAGGKATYAYVDGDPIGSVDAIGLAKNGGRTTVLPCKGSDHEYCKSYCGSRGVLKCAVYRTWLLRQIRQTRTGRPLLGWVASDQTACECGDDEGFCSKNPGTCIVGGAIIAGVLLFTPIPGDEALGAGVCVRGLQAAGGL